jgi:hypothetical protein
MTNLSPQFSDAQLNDSRFFWPVHRGLANTINGTNDDGTPATSTFENYDEVNARLVERGDKPQGIGIHWTNDPGVAKNFATDYHASDSPVDQPKVAGVVYHGYVQPNHVWDYDEPGSLDYHEEHEIYHPDSEEYGHDFGESEVTVKENKPVHISETTTYIRQEPFKKPVPFKVSYDRPFNVKA